MSENQCSKIVVEVRLIEEKKRGKLNKNMVGGYNGFRTIKFEIQPRRKPRAPNYGTF